jgi:hypothetical protein
MFDMLKNGIRVFPLAINTLGQVILIVSDLKNEIYILKITSGLCSIITELFGLV